ncbi:ribosome small subunit-dependent GTPase A [Actinomycetaceae bacterium L2_0104]
MRRDIGTDDPRVRVRPGRASRPRTKIRPDYSDAPLARVIGVDRGRSHLLLDDGVELTAVKARELGRRAIVVGDRVRVTGDLSGGKDTLARVVKVEERTSELRRSTEEGDGRERVIVANADQLAIVVALANPDPKPGMIDRCLVAAYVAGMTPFLVLTKADLASAADLLDRYEPLGLPAYVTDLSSVACDIASSYPPESPPVDLSELRDVLAGHETVLVGHSGVGKSTLINALVPEAERTIGHVNEVTGKGRHTSTSAVSFALAGGGRIIDTPGVRSFGLAHVRPEDLLRGFSDLAEVAQECPRGCPHTADALDCALSEVTDERLKARVASFRRLLDAGRVNDWSNS